MVCDINFISSCHDVYKISGVYGTWDHQVQNMLSIFGHGKIHYVLKRFAEPLDRKSQNYQELSNKFPLI